MTTIFTRIIDGEIPGTFIYRDDLVVAFLSINPLARGHALVVPRQEVDEWTDLEPDVAGHLMRIAHLIGRAQKSAFACRRVGLIIAGYEVPHCHVHVIPTTAMSQLSFDNAAASVDRESLELAASALRDKMSSVGLEPSE